MKTLLSPSDIVRSGLCIGCGSCVSQSAGAAQMRFNSYGELTPSGSGEWFRKRTPIVNKTCPFSPDAMNEDQLAAELYTTVERSDELLGRFQTAYVGYVSEEDFRLQGSSGGMVTWVATELFRKNLVDGVAH